MKNCDEETTKTNLWVRQVELLRLTSGDLEENMSEFYTSDTMYVW